jgi:hypothetical protein
MLAPPPDNELLDGLLFAALVVGIAGAMIALIYLA